MATRRLLRPVVAGNEVLLPPIARLVVRFSGPVELGGMEGRRETLRDTTLLAVAVAWSGLQFGTLWIMQTSILPLLNSRSQADYVVTCQGIDMHLFHKIALSGGIVMMLNGAYLTFALDDTSAQGAAAIATLGMIGVGAVSEAMNRPIWRKVERVWTPTEVPDNWQELRRTWSLAHSSRAAIAFIALVAFTTAFVVEHS